MSMVGKRSDLMAQDRWCGWGGGVEDLGGLVRAGRVGQGRAGEGVRGRNRKWTNKSEDIPYLPPY